MSAIVRGDARAIPLADESVDLIVTSPSYFGQRSYKDGGEHYAGQVGDEPHPREYVEALWSVMAECWRVLKRSGSAWVNLGDKRSGSHAPGTTSGLGGQPQGVRTGITEGSRRPDSGGRQGDEPRARRGYTRAAFGRAKSKQLLPHRFAIGCEDGAADPDGIGWIVRQEQVWWKRNGLPESVTDRTRDQHEFLFHLTKEGDYYAALDELREPHSLDWSEGRPTPPARARQGDEPSTTADAPLRFPHPLGALPGSVWHLSTEPLAVPAWIEVDHFAAFPSEIPRRLILGWSPPGICLECGEGRVPVSESQIIGDRGGRQFNPQSGNIGVLGKERMAQILGYACACTPYTDHPRPGRSAGKQNKDPRHAKWDGAPTGLRESFDREFHLDGWTAPPTRPAVVLDPFGGTGTTAMVARALGRVGISLDLSADYSRLAHWRVFESGHGAKAVERTNRERQGVLL